MTRAENYVTVEFLSRSSNEGFARVAAAGFAAQLDPTLDELGDIKTAVSEAVTNAIVHAYPDKLGKIVLKLKIREGNVLEITVRDWGKGIEDPEASAIQTPTADCRAPQAESYRMDGRRAKPGDTGIIIERGKDGKSARKIVR